MKPQLWLPVLAFLAVSLPMVLLLQALDWGGEYRLWIAIVAGALAVALVQSRLKTQAGGDPT
jgi:carbon starvation protein CstA